MTVAGDTICLHAFIHFAEQIRCLSTSSGSGGSGLGINNQRIRIDQPFLHHRIRRKNRTGGITARIGNQPCGLIHQSPVDLAETVDRLLDKLRTLVLNLVPFLIGSYIFNTKIRTQIHDLDLA